MIWSGAQAVVPAEQVGLFAVLVLDHDRDVVERAGELRWKIGQRCVHLLFEIHQ